MNTSIETNTCMTLINYILILEKSEPSADKAILSSPTQCSLHEPIIVFLMEVLNRRYGVVKTRLFYFNGTRPCYFTI